MVKKVVAGVVCGAAITAAVGFFVGKAIKDYYEWCTNCDYCTKKDKCDLTKKECFKKDAFSPDLDSICEEFCIDIFDCDCVTEEIAKKVFENPAWQSLFLMRHDGLMSDSELAESMDMPIDEFTNLMTQYETFITEEMYDNWRGFSLFDDSDEEVDEPEQCQCDDCE